MAVVYQHIRLDTNEVFYVGIGKTEERAYSKNKRNSHWYNVINKCGYKVEIIYNDLKWNVACQMEKYLIAEYGRDDLGLGTLVNKTDGGDGVVGNIVSEKSKKLVSEKMKGNKNSLGRKVSEETRKKLSEAIKGRKPNLGKKHSEETKLKMSEDRKGKKRGPYIKIK